MDLDRSQLVQQLVARGRGMPAAQLGVLLEGACAGDPALREEVQVRLAALGGDAAQTVDAVGVATIDADPHTVAGEGADLSAAVALTAAAVPETMVGDPDGRSNVSRRLVTGGAALASETLPAQIGPFSIRKQLGRGGMGIVYEAEQSHPRRVVALKVIDAAYVTPASLRRFDLEADAMGRLEHVGIARMYQAGVAGTAERPQPYFAMELVRGESLTDYASSHGLDVLGRLELLARICDAVHYAHQRGVIHRDLKPANILVDAAGQPKILDFGVARVTDPDEKISTLSTEGNGLVGTILYMSPEQAGGDLRDLDTRSDIYALGVIGFELLAGRLPHPVADKPAAEVLRMIRYDDPATLASLDRGLAGDVDAVIAKALEKDRDRRYASAAGLAADIRRFLDHEPVLARTHTLSYRARMFTQRHALGVAALSAVMVALLAGVVASGVSLRRAVAAQREQAAEKLKSDEQARVAQQERAEAKLSLVNSLVDQGGALSLAGLPGQADAAYEAALAQLSPGVGPAWQVDPARLDLWQRVPPALALIEGGDKPATAAGLLPDGRTLWTLDPTGWWKYDGATGRALDGARGEFAGASLSAWDGGSATLLVGGRRIGVRLLDVRSGMSRQLGAAGGELLALAVSRGGRFAVAAVGEQAGVVVTVWDLGSGGPALRIPLPESPTCLAVSPDGRRVLAGRSSGGLDGWDVVARSAGKQLVAPQGARPATCACFVGDDIAVSGGGDRGISVWDLKAGGGPVRRLAGHRGGVTALAASDDGRRVVSGGTDQTVRVWDVGSGANELTFAAHHAPVRAVALARGGRCVVSTGADGDVMLCDLQRRPVPAVAGIEGPLAFTAVSADGLMGIIAKAGGRAVLVDLVTARRLGEIDAAGAKCAAFVPNAGRVVICGPGASVRAWDMATWAWAWTAQAASGNVTCVAVSVDGRRVACGTSGGGVDLFDPASGASAGHGSVQPGQLDVACVALSADGKWCACGTFDPAVFLCDLEAGAWHELGSRGPVAQCIAFDAQGKRVLAGGHDGVLRVWDAAELRLLNEYGRHETAVVGAAASGDGRWAISGGEDGSLKVWGLSPPYRQVGTLAGDTAGIDSIVATPRGWVGVSRAARVWNFALAARYREGRARVASAGEALREGGNDPTAMAAMGAWYADWGPADWAADLLEQAAALRAETSALALARAYWSLGKGDAAAREFERAASAGGASLPAEGPVVYLKLCARAAGESARK